MEEFGFVGKKKRKRRNTVVETPLGDSGFDEEYFFLLSRLYKKMGKGLSKPEKFVIEQPFVEPFGRKKTAFLNLLKVCRSMQRDPSHYVKFLEIELGTTAFADSHERYVTRGRFMTEQVKNVTGNYIRSYVICPTCKSYTTRLEKQGRLFFLICERCKTKVSVEPLERGFVANTFGKE